RFGWLSAGLYPYSLSMSVPLFECSSSNQRAPLSSSHCRIELATVSPCSNLGAVKKPKTVTKNLIGKGVQNFTAYVHLGLKRIKRAAPLRNRPGVRRGPESNRLRQPCWGVA